MTESRPFHGRVWWSNVPSAWVMVVEDYTGSELSDYRVGRRMFNPGDLKLHLLKTFGVRVDVRTDEAQLVLTGLPFSQGRALFGFLADQYDRFENRDIVWSVVAETREALAAIERYGPD